MKFTILKNKSEIKDSDNSEVYVIDADEKIARSILESLKQKNIKKKIATFGRDNVFNRRALETLKINFLISPEREFGGERESKRKDTLKQRDSGLNHVIAKIAKDKDISMVIDIDDLSSIQDRKQKAKRLSRIIQNIKISRRAGCKILVWSLSGEMGKKELEAFGFSIGMSSQQVKESLS
ncbi:MAG: hypothetical protein WCP89_01570 [archaeon]